MLITSDQLYGLHELSCMDILDNSMQDIETKVRLGETIGHKLGV